MAMATEQAECGAKVEDRTHTIQELAKLMGMSEVFVWRRVTTKVIKARRFGKMWKIPADEVRRVLREGCE